MRAFDLLSPWPVSTWWEWTHPNQVTVDARNISGLWRKFWLYEVLSHHQCTTNYSNNATLFRDLYLQGPRYNRSKVYIYICRFFALTKWNMTKWRARGRPSAPEPKTCDQSVRCCSRYYALEGTSISSPSGSETCAPGLKITQICACLAARRCVIKGAFSSISHPRLCWTMRGN